MHLRTLTAAFFSTTVASALVFAVACSQATGSMSGSSSAGSPQETGLGAKTDDPGSTDASAREPSASAGPKSGAMPGESCADLAVDITNDPPDAGVAMNNATTAGDAGGSDRLVPMMEVIQKHRDKYRCCFDLWGRQHPGQEIKVTLAIKANPSGEVESTTFKPDATDLQDKDVEACMANVTRKLSFPPSPSGKNTLYHHPFNFKSRK